MEKISKWKIILISVAIVLAIASFSIIIFGLINRGNQEKETGVVGATEYYLVKKNTIQESPTDPTNIKTKMNGSTLTFYSKNDYIQNWTNPIFSVYFTGVTDYNNDYYNITGASITSCTVYNDWGLSFFNAFKSAGQVSFHGRYIKTDTIFGWGDEDKELIINKAPVSIFSLEGTININVDGTTYSKNYHGSIGLTYRNTDDNLILYCSSDGRTSIGSEEALKLFAYELRDTTCKTNKEIMQSTNITLDKDLKMDLISNMIPIGTSSVPFGGIFEGNKHKIAKLTVKLFDYVENAKIRNILLDEMNTTHCAPFAYSVKHSEIDNIFVKGFEFQYKVKSVDSYVGGLIGVISDGTTITNCRVDVGGEAIQETVTIPNSLTGTDIYYNTVMYCGGIVGIAKGDNNKIDNCFVNWTCGANAGYDIYFGGACGYSEKNININNTLIYFKSGYASNGYYIKDAGNSGKVQGKTAFAGSANFYSVSANSSLSNTYVFYGDIEFKKLSCRNGNHGASNNNQPLVSYYTVSTDTNSLNRQGSEYNGSLG